MKEQTSSYLYNHNLYCSVGVIFSALYISAHRTDISCTTTLSWMKKRLRSSGWGLASNWLKSLQPHWCCRTWPSSAPSLSRTWALFLTVNLLWLTTSRLSASRASFSYDSCEQSKSRCRQMHVRHSSRRSHTADWITATARLSVSQASSGSACSPYRMQRLAWLSVPASMTPSLLHCVISTGCQCANLSTLRWACRTGIQVPAWHGSTVPDGDVHADSITAATPATAFIVDEHGWSSCVELSVHRTSTTGLVNGCVSSTTEELVIHCSVRWLLVH